ncbi:hypothetical protein ABL78_2180 [Leptomonas seymouri]|uniref:Dynactin subunit 5 n=1 Tax=Leptomonas seymouri TaxID=5684 RepID=A0A0N1PFF8_LEPSE|nr:hypothetical protein ABL78_2180 [Leptomonas seymouri]|eukprot:KPI88720.1 hypothetical protein ABL78_2180 [Leptomonas seymouri]
MTSGSSCPLPVMHPTTPSTVRALTTADEPNSILTTSYEDVETATRSDNNTLIAHGTILHTELASFDIGAFTIIRRGAVFRPPVCVYVNQSAAGAQPSVKIGAFVYVGPRVVCEAAEIGQLVRMDEECVVAGGARIPDGVWLRPKTYVPPDAVLAPYTMYRGIPACPVEKLNAHVFQSLHLEFLRELRALADQKMAR